MTGISGKPFIYLYLGLLFVAISATGVTATDLPRPVLIGGPYSETVNDLDILHRNYTKPADAPTPPGDTFNPTVYDITPGSTAPEIGEFTRQAGVDRAVVLQGSGFTRGEGATENLDTKVWLYNQTTSSNACLFEARFLKKTPTILTTVTQGVTTQTLNYGMFMAWVENEDGVSYPVRVNATEAWWLGPYYALCGGQVSVYGRNLSHDNGTASSYVYIRPWGAGSGTASTACTVNSVNPYKVTFTVPAGLTTNADYEVWIHNGHGGQYGWSGPLKLRVDATERYQWNGTVRNVTSYGAIANDGNDDRAAIQSAINACSDGDTVYLPAGTFEISTDLNANNKAISFEGAGKTSTVLQTYSGGFTSYYGLLRTNKGSFRVRNLTLKSLPGYSIPYGLFQANGYNLATAPEGIIVQNVQGETPSDTTVAALSISLCKDVKVKDCTFYSSGSVYYGACRYLYIQDNDYYGRAHTFNNNYGNAYALNSSQCIDFSSNYIACQDRETDVLWVQRGVFVQTPNWPAIKLYIADNETSECGPYNCAQNTGENILLEAAGTPRHIGSPSSVSSTTLTFSGTSWSTDQFITDGLPGYWMSSYNQRSVVYVSRGAGMGQWRRITANTATTITVDRPWDVQPDTDSQILVCAPAVQYAIYRNTLQGPLDDDDNGVPDYRERDTATAGVELFGTCLDGDITGNTISRMRSGLYSAGFASGLKGASPPSVCIVAGSLVSGNTVQDCWDGLRFRTGLSEASGQTASGDPGIGPVMLADVARDNSFSGLDNYGLWIDRFPSTSYIWTDWPWIIQNAVCDNNIVSGGVKGAIVGDCQAHTILYGNNFQLASADANAVGVTVNKNSGTGDGHVMEKNPISANFGKYLDTVGDSDKLLGWWKMDEASWNSTQLEVKDAESLISDEGQAFSGASTVLISGSNRAGAFDGTNDYVSLGIRTALGFENLTASAWFKINGAGSTSSHYVLCSRSLINAGYKGLGFFYAGYIAVITGRSGTTGNNLQWDVRPFSGDGLWHHAALTYDASTQTANLYGDGVLRDTMNVNLGRIEALDSSGNPVAFFIGSRNPVDSFFNGNVNDVRLYGRALSNTEVAAIYSAGP